MTTLLELELIDKGYSCIGRGTVSDRFIQDNPEYKNNSWLDPTSKELVKMIKEKTGKRSVRLVSYDCRRPFEIVLIYVK